MATGELRAAIAIASAAKVQDYQLVRLPDLREAGDMKGAEFPGMPPSYIPMRNSIFYGFAASFAEETRSSYIMGGHNADDMRLFSDAGDEFFANLEAAFQAASPVLRSNKTAILRPLREMTKPQVVSLAVRMGVPLELTWSCHRTGARACWRCPGCLSRKSAFESAGEKDPLREGRRTN